VASLLSAGLFAAPAFGATTTATTTHKSTHGSSAHSPASAASASHSSHRSASSHASKAGSRTARSSRHIIHGQQSIDPDRATQIQQALIREHYLNGEPTGQWDDATVAAMQKYQADQGWQTKLMPDSRALKKLGLGPDYSNALNAQSSNFGDPPPAAPATPSDQVAGFTAASGVH
jgi:Putative peptidoglycan binding domain